MMKNSIESHKFDRHQHVSFLGGEGIIQGFKLENGNWRYAIEMPQGGEGGFGGGKTTSNVAIRVFRHPLSSDRHSIAQLDSPPSG
ncbi:hypothetical protein [Chamaesiphon minutus]|uniref:Uncharacterized protein n=1 Tax=Chamaesiphon minutus (strain ATCC 27169 / PCC 6605) TaxID=1173020 RepID=K9ULP9_CHAP6|nr:hypothetical protein [Chamaesiphon minutus]AFY95346.1 hypothetical protein Cha6605_4413 [Chamaesiphon minutus PCC 6605]